MYCTKRPIKHNMWHGFFQRSRRIVYIGQNTIHKTLFDCCFNQYSAFTTEKIRKISKKSVSSN